MMIPLILSRVKRFFRADAFCMRPRRRAQEEKARLLKIESLEARQLLSVAPWEVGQANLAAFYSFENGNQSVVGSVHGVSYGDASTQYCDVLESNVLTLDGSGDYVSLGNPDSLNGLQSFTLSAWVKADASSGFQNILAHGYTQTPKAEIFLRIANGYYEIGSWNGANHRARVAIPQTDIGQWVHLAGTFDGASWRLYRNGVELAVTHDSACPDQIDAGWSIGSNSTGSERYFQGELDHVAIHNRALTSSEILQMAMQNDVQIIEPISHWDCISTGNDILADANEIAPGTLKNDAKFLADQTRYSVLDLDGDSAYVALGDPEDLQITGEITLSAWIHPKSLDGVQNLISKGFSMDPKGEIFLRIANGYYEIGSWNGANHRARVAIPQTDIGQWVHLAGTFDGASWRLYRNGVEVAYVADTVGAVAVNSAWSIGANSDGTTRFFDGMISDVKIFRSALMPPEVLALHDASVTVQAPVSEVPHLRVGGESYALLGQPYTLDLDTLGYGQMEWTIKWGDNTEEVTSLSKISHTYQASGTYEIIITAKRSDAQQAAMVFGDEFTISVFGLGSELLTNGNFDLMDENSTVPLNQFWELFPEGITGWDGLIELQRVEGNQYAELDADLQYYNGYFPDPVPGSAQTTITASSVSLAENAPHLLTFDAWNRTSDPLDNMMKVTVPGTIQAINGYRYDEILALINSNDSYYDYVTLTPNSVTFSAKTNLWRCHSILFLASGTGSVSFSDVSTTNPTPTYGACLDSVSLKPYVMNHVDLRVDSGNDGNRIDNNGVDQIDHFDNLMENKGVGYVLEMGTTGSMSISVMGYNRAEFANCFVKLTEVDAEGDELPAANKILTISDPIGINLSEFKTTGTCNIEAKTLHESQSTWVKVAVYKKVNDQDVRVDTMEDLVKITTSLFVMQDTRNVIPNYGQPLEKSQDRTKMWNCDIVTDTYQTPCSGPRYSGSYLKSSISYATTGFTMDLDYDFIRGNDGNGNIYGDAYGYQKGIRPGNVDDINNKLSFVANGGVKFGSSGGYGSGVFEVALLDMIAIVNKIAEVPMFKEDGTLNLLDEKTNPHAWDTAWSKVKNMIQANGTLSYTDYEIESLSKLLNAVGYGQNYQDMDKYFGGKDLGIDTFLSAIQESYKLCLATDNVLTIIATTQPEANYYSSVNVVLNGANTFSATTFVPAKEEGPTNILKGDGHIYLQSHWGSGVVYKITKLASAGSGEGV
ncbi:MAG: LamG-like jellyroll fold domain-containing protein [Planctomycetia bacterium]|nr:LamG-like jellyroll fold domain-containing protein [Planctomycetia bacterium]